MDNFLNEYRALPMRSRRCQYGVFIQCLQAAVTKRQRPAGGETWDLCRKHAEIIDRVRENVKKHGNLLERLK